IVAAEPAGFQHIVNVSLDVGNARARVGSSGDNRTFFQCGLRDVPLPGALVVSDGVATRGESNRQPGQKPPLHERIGFPRFLDFKAQLALNMKLAAMLYKAFPTTDDVGGIMLAKHRNIRLADLVSSDREERSCLDHVILNVS